jgi:hypothetical protein
MYDEQNDQHCNSNDKKKEIDPAAGDVEFHQPGHKKKIEKNMDCNCQRS